MADQKYAREAFIKVRIVLVMASPQDEESKNNGVKGSTEEPVSLVSYKEDSSGSEQEEEGEDEYLIPRKRPRLDKDKLGKGG